MKKLLITILIFISACSSSKNELSSNFSVEFFPDNMTIEEFKNRLEEYANNSPYPNINN